MKIVIIVLVLMGIGWAAIRYAGTQRMRALFSVATFGSLAVILATGLLSTNTIIFFAICFLASFVGVSSRIDGACRFIILAALVPGIRVPLHLVGAYLGDLQPMTLFLAGLTMTCLLRPDRRSRRPFGAEDVTVLVVTLILAYGMARSWSATSLLRQTFNAFVSIPLPYYLLTRSIRTREDLERFAAAIAGAGVILSVMAFYEARSAWSTLDLMWQNYDPAGFVTRNLRVRSGFLRAPTTFNESTSFAVFQAMAFFATLSARRFFRSVMLWRIACVVVLVGLATAQSRGALIAVALAYGATLLYRRSAGQAGSFVAIAALLGTLLVVVGKTNDRVASFTQASAAMEGEDYRQQLLRRGLEEGMKHFWLGDDISNVIARMPDMVQGEHIVDLVNSYLVLFISGGIVGLTIFVLSIAALGGRLWQKTKRAATPEGRAVEGFVVGGLTAVLIALLFTSFYERNPLWLLTLLAAAKVLMHSPAGGSRDQLQLRPKLIDTARTVHA